MTSCVQHQNINIYRVFEILNISTTPQINYYWGKKY